MTNDILVIVHDDGTRECCTFEDWCTANVNDPNTAAIMAELVQNCAIITLDGDAQTTGRRMWLESNEVDENFTDEPGAERFYVC